MNLAFEMDRVGGVAAFGQCHDQAMPGVVDKEIGVCGRTALASNVLWKPVGKSGPARSF